MKTKTISQPAKVPFRGFRGKTILLAFAIFFHLANCTGKSKQPKESEAQQTEVVDTNKIYEA